MTEPACLPDDHPTALRLLGDPAALDRAAGLLRALGDPGRLRLVAVLMTGEACVTELVAATGDRMNTISQRLRLLHLEGLVARDRRGKHVYYRLADDHVQALVANALEHAIELGGGK